MISIYSYTNKPLHIPSARPSKPFWSPDEIPLARVLEQHVDIYIYIYIYVMYTYVCIHHIDIYIYVMHMIYIYIYIYAQDEIRRELAAVLKEDGAFRQVPGKLVNLILLKPTIRFKPLFKTFGSLYFKIVPRLLSPS